MKQIPVLITAILTAFALDAAAFDKISDIPAPAGYTRVAFPKGSYQFFIRSLPLRKTEGISAYDGSRIDSPLYSVFAVVDMPLLFRKDIEQCADWGMRFWGEYHRVRGKLDQFYLFSYEGKRISFTNSGKTYRDFLESVFIHSNSYSLKKGCARADAKKLEPGDMIIQNERGGVGHVTIIVDASENSGKERIYLAGFSFMPAQEFHVEKWKSRSGWFTYKELCAYLEENFPYGKPEPYRFR